MLGPHFEYNPNSTEVRRFNLEELPASFAVNLPHSMRTRPNESNISPSGFGAERKTICIVVGQLAGGVDRTREWDMISFLKTVACEDYDVRCHWEIDINFTSPRIIALLHFAESYTHALSLFVKMWRANPVMMQYLRDDKVDSVTMGLLHDRPGNSGWETATKLGFTVFWRSGEIGARARDDTVAFFRDVKDARMREKPRSSSATWLSCTYNQGWVNEGESGSETDTGSEMDVDDESVLGAVQP
jgi:hypothetical protein